MREIKFRVRNLKHDHFEDLSDIIITFDGIGFEIYNYEGSVLDGCELNQYTGLKDNNGKEIYEGDILRIDDDICFVEFKNYGFGVTSKEYDEYCLFGEEDLSVYTIEIVGNIYENPELLSQNIY